MGRRITRGSLYFASSLAAAILPAQAVADSDLAQPMLAQVAACVPPQAPASPATPNPPPLLVSGLGYAGIAPDTADAEARRWFEQGVRLIWAFDEVEAIRAFEQAQRIDPACALCAWGEAWARGPTINLQPRTEEHGKAAAASARAERLSGKLSRRDTQLIRAMQVRTGGAGKFRNKAYAKAMARLALRFPADDAAAVMAADAAMVAAPRRGLKEGSNAQRLLESVLRRNPDHSGAIHMYIHLTDWIDRQDLAERHADRLGRLAPAASHLVHMPSHTFYGVGRYADAAAVNVAALAADQAYEAKVKPPASDYRTGLYAHNSNFAIGGALMNGDGKTALKIADHFADRFRAKPDFGRGVRAAIYYAYGLYAAKADVLALPVPAGAALRAMRLYARGEAFARSGDAAAVRAEAAAIAALRASPEGRAFGGRPAEALVEIAQHVLELSLIHI